MSNNDLPDIAKKKKVKMKYGIWENRVKLRKVLARITFTYGGIMTLFGVIGFMNGLVIISTSCIILAIPAWFINVSHYKYQKAKVKLE